MEVRDGLACVFFFRFFLCRILMMERGCRKGLQFYTDLTELMVKLGSETRSFVSERTSQRQALVGKLEAEKRLSAVAATSPPLPLAAKPPLLPPPPFKPYTLDGAFDGLNLGRGSPQQTQQQWQNNGSTPSPPPPPPVPNRNSYASPLQQQPLAPYGVSSPAPGPSPYTQYPTHKPTLPPPPSSTFLSPSSHSTFVFLHFSPRAGPVCEFWRGSLERRAILWLVGRVSHCNRRLGRVYHHNHRVHYRHH